MKKIRLHPFFLILCIILILTSKAQLLCISIICVAVHEYGHYLCARHRGYSLSSVTLMPYGAVLGGEGVSEEDMPFVASAGPIVNFLLAITTVAFWWFFPESYGYTLLFFRVNVTIGSFNLLPLYPLDGGRILLSLCKNKILCLKFLRINGIVISILFAVLFFVSSFYQLNFTFAAVSVMLFIGGFADTEKEKYTMLVRDIFCLTDFSRPVPQKSYYIRSSAKVADLLRVFRGGYYYVAYVLNERNITVKTLQGIDLEKLFLLSPAEKSQSLSSVYKL